jgi:S1-C subfamily serine protease
VKLRVVSADETNDLALLQGTKKFKEKDVATIRASAVNAGDQHVAIGYPLHGLLTSDRRDAQGSQTGRSAAA